MLPKAENPIAAVMASSLSGEVVLWIGEGRFIVLEILGWRRWDGWVELGVRRGF